MPNNKPLSRTIALSLAIAIGSIGATGTLAAQNVTQSAAQHLTGELTSRSAVNANNGSRYQKLNVSLEGGKMAAFTLSGAFSGSMTLQDAKGNVLGTSFGANSGNTLMVEVPRNGRYVLLVSGQDSESFGPFQVEYTYSDVRNSGTLALNELISGFLTSDSAGNIYNVTISEAGRYRFDMESDEIDSLLNLTGNDFNVSDDDGGNRLNARITTFLQPGDYRLTAKSVGDDAGNYTLRMTSQPLPAGVQLQNGGTLPLDTAITGLYSGRPATYSLNVPRHALAIVDMKSEDIDSVLEINGPGVALKDDDSGANLDARILSVLSPGTYTITATAFESSSSGIFTLSARLRDVLPANTSTIRPGQALEKPFNNHGANTVELQIDQAGTYVIDLLSGDFDTMLNINGQGLHDSDDDGGDGTNSRLTLSLSPGRYQLRASAYDDRNVEGRYVFIVDRR